MKIIFFTMLFTSQLAFSTPKTSEWLIDLEKGSGSVEFRAIGRPSALKIHGKGEKAKGILTVKGLHLEGKATVVLNSFDTGIKLRNEHMKKKYLETEKYPEAKFIFTKTKLSETLKSKDNVIEKFPFEGKLFLHGVEKTILGTTKVEKKGNEILVIVDFGLKISDFKIATPGFAGITMAENVEVQVQFRGPYTTRDQ